MNTRRLFVTLLPKMRITAVCDVGSMDGDDALLFRRALPHASIYAFEANLENFRQMSDNPELRRQDIRVLPMAVAAHDGFADFYVVQADYSGRNDFRGMSSLYARSGALAPAAVVQVQTTRLDSFLSQRTTPGTRLALWIDAEGKTFEVIEGIVGLAPLVQLLHVEVETIPCIAAGQRLYQDVKQQLAQLGFIELAADQARTHLQFNALFVRDALSTAMRLRVRSCLLRAQLRSLFVAILKRFWPSGLRALVAVRAGADRTFKRRSEGAPAPRAERGNGR